MKTKQLLVFAAAAGSVALFFAFDLRQYLSLLAADAQIEGIDLESAETPLVQ